MEYVTTLTANQPIAITIGNFDGVHKGHQRLMHELRKTAQELSCTPVLVTFSPHTLMVVLPDLDVRYLTTLEEKLTLATKYGDIADSIVIKFTPAVTAMSAGTNFHFILVLPLRAVIIEACLRSDSRSDLGDSGLTSCFHTGWQLRLV